MHTVWEITHGALGAQDALAGGGRYQIDVQKKLIDGVGFAMGIERIIAALEAAGTDAKELSQGPALWIISQSDSAFEDNLILLQTLRRRGVRCGMDLKGRSMKAQLRAANRAGAQHVVIRGDHEMESGTFQLKNFSDGSQDEVDMPELMQRLEPLRVNS